MKKSILVLAIAMISINAFTQQISYSDLNTDKRPAGPFTSYLSKDGTIYNVGDVLTIGVPSSNKTFAYISQGDGILYAPEQLNARFAGDKTEIKSIWIGGTKRSGFSVLIRSKSASGITTYTVYLENAIASGEIKSFGITSDDALSELKKNKDKLDLGLISQEKYDSLKVELSKYIR
jgi:hypothetical protein